MLQYQYPQKYKKEWEEILFWLKEERGKTYSKLCFTKLENNRTNLVRHDKENQKHRKLEKKLKMSSKN